MCGAFDEESKSDDDNQVGQQAEKAKSGLLVGLFAFEIKSIGRFRCTDIEVLQMFESPMDEPNFFYSGAHLLHKSIIQISNRH